MVNVERLRTELEFITAHPKQWNQLIYVERTACGTVGCLAGNTVLHEGLQLRWYKSCGVWYAEEVAGNEEISIFDEAARILDIGILDAEMLFNGGADILDLWEAACRITGGQIEVPSDLPVSSDESTWV